MGPDATHRGEDHAHGAGDPRLVDSAGQPWAGRELHAPAFAQDDGSADPRLIEAIHRFRSHEVSPAEVVAALAGTRLLVPLVAVLGEAAPGPHGKLVDKSAELAIVTVEGRDGRRVLPAFTSVQALQTWNPKARPVPVEAERVALAAASEETDLVILDPRSDTEFGLRRSALEALARGSEWRPPWQEASVVEDVRASVADEPAVVAVDLIPGDPEATLVGAELAIRLELRPGLDREALDGLLARLGASWATSAGLASVDGVAVSLATAR